MPHIDKKTLTKKGYAVGLAKGFITTKFEAKAGKSHGIGKRVTAIRSLIREVTGLAPYEKRVVELIKSNAPKRALKYAKKRLGGHVRGKAKKDELTEVIMKAREKKE